ncbi:hypothetical protein MYXA107069_16755 [Myxococcus xanthus]
MQPLQPGAHGARRGQAHSHGDGVDEQAHHRLDAGKLRGPAGDGQPEQDVVLSGIAPQQQRPGRLQQRASRDALLAREGLQCRRLLRAHPEQHFTQERHITQCPSELQAGGLREARQRAAPEVTRGAKLLTPQPRDVVAVRPHGASCQRHASPQCLIPGEDLPQHHLCGPPVQQQVRQAEHHAPHTRSRAKHRQPEAGRAGEHQPPSAILLEERGQSGLLVGLGQVAQVLDVDGRQHLAHHRLERRVQPLPEERGPEDGVLLGGLPPRFHEGARIQWAFELEGDLIEVRLGLTLLEMGDQDSMLER